MHAKFAFAAAALLGAVSGGVHAGSPARAASSMCPVGTHADAAKHCQPDSASGGGRCPSGLEEIPAMNGDGYRCVPSRS